MTGLARLGYWNGGKMETWEYCHVGACLLAIIPFFHRSNTPRLLDLSSFASIIRMLLIGCLSTMSNLKGIATNSDQVSISSSATCRFCGAQLHHSFVDLGMSPLCESYISRSQLNQVEHFYPLHVYICERCFLVQLEEYVSADVIFTEYAYFSSYSDSWVDHAQQYVHKISKRLALGNNSLAVEVASNDGYLLQHFISLGIPVLGVEPADNVAQVAIKKGIPTRVEFFGKQSATRLVEEGLQADLLIGNNILAQVPDLNDFVAGIKILLKPDGVATLEFPHLLNLIEENQFDSIYHEHFSYFSFRCVERIFVTHGMTLFDVETLSTHGGSLRIYARHAEYDTLPIRPNVERLRLLEENAGLERLDSYARFEEQVKETKRNLLEFLIRANRNGKQVAGYGAPGKGNTLLNYCGIRTDLLDYTVDRNPYKQGKFLPGTHIPIYEPTRIKETRPEYVLILPWNLREEIMAQLAYIREWDGQFVTPIPRVTVD
ncbi:MAG: class I SAM-dependent methyltransferase [Pirellulales bacterium]